MSHESVKRWWQSQTVVVSAAAFVLLAMYVGAYLQLTGRGIREAVAEGDTEFLYVSCPGRAPTEADYLAHRWRRSCFKPLELLDPRMGPGKWRARIFLRDLP